MKMKIMLVTAALIVAGATSVFTLNQAKEKTMTTSIETFNPQPTYETFKPFNLSLAAKASDLLFVTGQIGFDDNGGFPGDYDAQVENVFLHLDRILKDAGADWSNVVQLRSFHVGGDLEGQFPKLLEVKARYMPEHQHAWTAIAVNQLVPSPSLIEIDLIAYTGDR